MKKWLRSGISFLLAVAMIVSNAAFIRADEGVDITSGLLIQYNTTVVDGVDMYDFGPVSWFWLAAALISFALPVLNWKKMKQ